jgi:hypothetical protein
MPTTILLISLIWLVALAMLVYRLATRPAHESTSRERSPSLLRDGGAAFEQPPGAVLASKPATAKNVRDRAQKDLYVRP